ncbi:MAG: protein translocase subunit SecD [Phycisphaerae bacterium]|jgi:SecD/SecF fusion protein
MDRNVVRFGLIGVFILVVFIAFQLYPPSETLKPGIDLAGGTSLIYEIDTTGLTPQEADGLSQKFIPILMKRIDPGNVQNIIMRPQGDTRIEIQVPLSSADTYKKRQTYDKAVEAITKDNINPAIIRRALTKPAEERAALFAQMAGDSNDRNEILTGLSAAYDARKAAQEKRDSLKTTLSTISSELQKSGINDSSLVSLASSWSSLDPNGQTTKINQLITDANSSTAQKTRPQVEEYIRGYQQWSQVVNELTTPQTGLNAVYKQAEDKLKNFNLGIDSLTEILEMPEKSVKRTEMLDQFKAAFPSRAEKIDALDAVFKDYRLVRGRIDGPEDVKRMLKGAGVLEFRILPKLDDGRTNKEEMNAYAEALKTKGPKLASDNKYVWILIETPEDPSWQPSERNPIVVGSFAEKYYVLTSNQKGECLLRNSGKKPWKLEKSSASSDQLGKRAIAFNFDEVGASLFYDVTRNNLQRPLCITLDGVAISAPNIRSAIRSSGVIEGDYTQIEQMDMINKLNAGSLPARLIEPPISEKTIGPLIGADNRAKGITACYYSFLAVAGFMMFYYLIGGAIADVALFINVLIILGMMALSSATFTLSGIAGIILTIGMSVDANVLIFERIREEQAKGASIRTAIENGYRRVFWVIFDSNLTTIITAVILYMIGSEEIKGFAITLIIGLVSSVFTSLIVTRLIFQLMLNTGLLKNKLMMLQVFKNSININWMKIAPVMMVISLSLLAGSWIVFFTRDDSKNNKYDIEFTGGTSVQVDLKSECGMSRDAVEDIIRKQGEMLKIPAISSARVYSVGNKNTKTQYEITTTETNKANADITFKPGSQETIETVTDAIEKAQVDKRSRITGLTVAQNSENPAKFTITTTQTNKSVVSLILGETFGDKAEISAPVVNEIVTTAVLNAFKDKLQIMENLGPQIVSSVKITDAMVAETPEFGDFIDGIKIEFALNKPVTIAEMEKRLNDLRFKPDMESMAWYRYKIMAEGVTDSNAPAVKFIYASILPDTGYRQLSDDEWTNFTANEIKKITAAAELKSSLSRVTQFSASLGKEAKTRAIIASVLSLVAMMIYLGMRFGNMRYGFGALFSLLHDVSIALGFLVASTYFCDTSIGQKLLIGDFKIDLAAIAAFLTIIGYSVNDTIVIYDRIRETKGRLKAVTPQMINDSINQMLPRTFLTSFVTMLAVVIMYIFGGDGFRSFNYIMIIGMIVGVYSTIVIAAPVLLIGLKTKTDGDDGL